MKPFGVVVGAELFFIPMDIDEGKIGDAEGPFYGVAERVCEGLHLFQVYTFEAGEFFENAVGGLLEVFFGLEEASHEAPFTFLGFESSLDEQ